MACPCGSGRKYKRCCLPEEERAATDARLAEAIGRRIESWSSSELRGELEAAVTEFARPGLFLGEADFPVFRTWFHNDRPLAGGDTPAERFAARPDLSEAERRAAARLAGARLGLHRVLAVDPGRSLLLEDIFSGERAEVRSPHVSREAVRFDIMLARVVPGDPPSLWGPVRFFEPHEERELRGELERVAGRVEGPAAVEALRGNALALIRFVPESRAARPTFYTLEGDPLVFASAVWDVLDPAAAVSRMRELADLHPDDPLELDITAERSDLVRQRPPLPPGALVLESSVVGAIDTISIATWRLDDAELHVEAMSEERLDRMLDLVAHDFGALVAFRSRSSTPVDEALPEDDGVPERPPARSRAAERRLGTRFANERMLRWLDEPHQSLAGRTPREAAADSDREQVVDLLRQIENTTTRSARRGGPSIDVEALRAALGVRDDLAA